MQQAGIDTAVCACGTALTPDQVRLISQYAEEVILCYDSDEAGQKSDPPFAGAVPLQPGQGGRASDPGAKDPDEYIKKYGPERFQALLDGVGSALDFRLENLRRKYDLKEDSQRLQYVKEAVEMLAQRSNPTEREVSMPGGWPSRPHIYKSAILAQLAQAGQQVGRRQRREQNRAILHSGEMDTIEVPYSAGGRQALGVASAQQRLLAAVLREPRYLPQVQAGLQPEQFLMPLHQQIYQAMLDTAARGEDLPAVLHQTLQRRSTA